MTFYIVGCWPSFFCLFSGFGRHRQGRRPGSHQVHQGEQRLQWSRRNSILKKETIKKITTAIYYLVYFRYFEEVNIAFKLWPFPVFFSRCFTFVCDASSCQKTFFSFLKILQKVKDYDQIVRLIVMNMWNTFMNQWKVFSVYIDFSHIILRRN